MRDLHYDYETFSTVDLKKCGHYRYAEEAEIILLAYAFDNEPVQQVDCLSGEAIPQAFIDALADPTVNKFAHNSGFERVITKACLGIDYPLEQTYCTSVWAASLGLPAHLDGLSEVLGLGDKAKLKTGKALIRKFCVPRKPTKKILRTRNLPSDFPEDWEEFKRYNIQDVEAEREVHRRMKPYPMPESEWALYRIDQRINDRGIRLDTKLVRAAIKLAEESKAVLIAKAIEITQLANPNSRNQLIEWLDTEDVITADLTKKTVEQLIGGGTSNEKVIELLKLRQQIAKTSVTKYQAMARAVCSDGRLRGMFKFNGAGRTARWAGQIVQLQNLPSKGLIKDIELARRTLLEDPDSVTFLWNDISQMLSSLIRTAMLPDAGEEMPVIDFSSIEARILAWLANETWRLELFATGGKLYETSAEKMFNLPAGSVTKKDPNRQKGKVAELALGYQGWEGALITMGALDMGLTLEELAPIASAWRKANQAIESLWYASEDAALKAAQSKTRVPVLSKYQKTPLVHYESDGKFLTCILPSGRKLYYAKPKVGRNDRGVLAVSFEGVDGVSKQWRRTWLYGGLLVENQCQAVARDCLCDFLVKLDQQGYKTLLHVHDEVAVSVPEGKATLKHLEVLMAEPLPWAPGLLLTGDGFVTNFYRKDPDD